MKRPMCFISIVLLAFVIFLLTIVPPSVYNDTTSLKQEIRVEGRVKDKYSKNGSLYLCLVNAGVLTGNNPSEQKNGVIVKLNESYTVFEELPQTGSHCVISGKKMLFQRSSNPGQFDLGFYEMLKGFDYELYDSELVSEKTSGDPADWLMEILCRLRHRWGVTYDELLNGDDAGVVRSMVLGDKNGLGDEIKGLYQRAGISHALCISGLHISLLGCGLYGMLKKIRLPRAPAGIISLLLMIIYGMMTGMGISTVRALIMFAAVMTAEMSGRSYDILSALSLAGTVILLAEPLCIYDAGFMLSFGAVLGIGTVSPALSTIFPFRSAVADSLKTSISVNLFTFPMILWFFYQFPMYSVFLNIILIPLMGILLLISFAAGIAGMLFLPAGRLPAFLCHLILSLYKGGCLINDELPGSVYVAGRPALWKMIVYYILLIVTVLMMTGVKKMNRKKTAAAVLIMAAGVLLLTVKIRSPFTMTVIDVGQGDSIFMQCSDSTSFLIDCGSSDVKEVAKYRVVPFLKASGTGRIDYAVVTHTDADHVNGFEEMLSKSDADGMPIGCLIMPDCVSRDEKYERLISLADEKGVPVRFIKSGDRIINDELRLTCLHPDKGRTYEDVNEVSTVLDVQYGKFTALLTGDIQGRGEEEMMKNIGHEYTVLKCAHHGSENSTPDEFLRMVRPKMTFISCGRDNSYGHPHAALLERLKKSRTTILTTIYTGAITLRTDGKEIKVEKFYK